MVPRVGQRKAKRRGCIRVRGGRQRQAESPPMVTTGLFCPQVFLEIRSPSHKTGNLPGPVVLPQVPSPSPGLGLTPLLNPTD